MDMERYGDYNEYEDDIPKSKNPVIITLKILISFVCLAVAGILIFRIMFFNFYPDSIKNLYFNEVLTAHYNEKGGDIKVETQEIRAKYDDPDVASFFCDNLFVIREANQLQLSIRFNVSAIEKMEKELSLTGLSADDPDLLSFKLTTYNDDYADEVFMDATVAIAERSSKLMYRYYKLVCDGVTLGGLNEPGWIRLDVFVKGSEQRYAYVFIYENNSAYSVFEEYVLSEEDRPSDN